MRIITVIQARTGSKRFPGKVLAPMSDGRTLLEHVVEAAEAIGYPVLLAIPYDDEQLVAKCRELKR